VQDIKLADRSMVWNTDLVEALELENLLINAAITMHSAEQVRQRGRGGTWVITLESGKHGAKPSWGSAPAASPAAALQGSACTAVCAVLMGRAQVSPQLAPACSSRSLPLGERCSSACPLCALLLHKH
jgi:hypothetical protein